MENAIDVSTMVSYVSIGIEDGLKRYYNAKSVENNNNPKFIVETTLNECQLGSTKEGVSVLVDATSRIIDRNTATVVWEYSSSHIVPVRESNHTTNKVTGSLLSVFSAKQLADLTDEEIQNSVYDAAAGAGALIAEQLREDISKIRSN